MFDFPSYTGTMLVKSLVHLFRSGQIDLDEVWDTIEKDMQCQEFKDHCTGYEPICVCSQVSNQVSS